MGSRPASLAENRAESPPEATNGETISLLASRLVLGTEGLLKDFLPLRLPEGLFFYHRSGSRSHVLAIN